MKTIFRQPTKEDLNRIMAIERSGFSAEEAASCAAMAERLTIIPDSFVLAIDDEDQIMGYAVGPVISERYLYDALFEKTQPNPKHGGYQTILSLVVDPAYRKYGVASHLLTELKKISLKAERTGITLTCLENLIPFYEKNGYRVEGISESKHAGEIWYNMVLDL